MCFLKVTVLYIERGPAISETFSFVLDPSLSNVTVYVTGDSPVFTLYSPTGEPVHLWTECSSTEAYALNQSVL